MLNAPRGGIPLAMRTPRRRDCPDPRHRAFPCGSALPGIHHQQADGAWCRWRGPGPCTKVPRAVTPRGRRPPSSPTLSPPHKARHRRARAAAPAPAKPPRPMPLRQASRGRALSRFRCNEGQGNERHAPGAMCSGRSTAMSRCAVRMVTVKPPSTSTQLRPSCIRNVAEAARGTAMNTMIITMNNTNDRM